MRGKAPLATPEQFCRLILHFQHSAFCPIGTRLWQKNKKKRCRGGRRRAVGGDRRSQPLSAVPWLLPSDVCVPASLAALSDEPSRPARPRLETHRPIATEYTGAMTTAAHRHLHTRTQPTREGGTLDAAEGNTGPVTEQAKHSDLPCSSTSPGCR